MADKRRCEDDGTATVFHHLSDLMFRAKESARQVDIQGFLEAVL